MTGIEAQEQQDSPDALLPRIEAELNDALPFHGVSFFTHTRTQVAAPFSRPLGGAPRNLELSCGI